MARKKKKDSQLAKLVNWYGELEKPETTRLLYIGLAAAFLYYCWYAFVVLHARITNFDEYGYVVQSLIFSHGKMFLTPAYYDEAMLEVHMMYNNGHLFSKYPPGFSILLIPFSLLGLYWLLNPILMVVGWVFIFKTICNYASRPAALAITLLAAFNAYSLGYAGSLFSQPISFCLSAITLWAFINYTAVKERKYIYYMGACLAYGFISRPLDFGCFTLAIVISYVICISLKRDWKNFLVMAGFILCGILLMTLYSSYQMQELTFSLYKDVLTTTLYVYDNTAQTFIGGIISALKQFVANYEGNAEALFVYGFLDITGVLPFLFFLLGLVAVFTRRNLCVFPLYIIIVVVVYNFHRSVGWPQYGARYWFATWGAFVVLAGAGWGMIERLFARFEKWLLKQKKYKPYKKYHVIKLSSAFGILLILIELISIATITPPLLERYEKRVDLLERAEINMKALCPLHSIVLIQVRATPTPADDDPFIEDVALKRNAFFNGSYVFAGMGLTNMYSSAYGREVTYTEIVDRLKYNFPGYQVCEYNVDYHTHY